MKIFSICLILLFLVLAAPASAQSHERYHLKSQESASQGKSVQNKDMMTRIKNKLRDYRISAGNSINSMRDRFSNKSDNTQEQMRRTKEKIESQQRLQEDQMRAMKQRTEMMQQRQRDAARRNR